MYGDQCGEFVCGYWGFKGSEKLYWTVWDSFTKVKHTDQSHLSGPTS